MLQSTALRVLQTGANVFLTGEPGSGKTHTVTAYVKWLRERGIDPSITASTGIAATHVGGMTIHAWCGIGIRRSLTEYDLDTIASNEKVVKRILHARILIIDEVSMLSADTLDMAETVCRVVRRVDAPFGGLQVVLVGDFFQLPPVMRQNDESGERLGFGENRSSNLPAGRQEFAFRSRAWKALNPVVCYLHEQYRQEDDTFLRVLSSIRKGLTDETTYEALESRFTKKAPTDIPHLYAHNANVDRVNDERLNATKGTTKVFHMQSRGRDALVAGLKRGCLSPETLSLKIGARVMFTKNSTDGSFVNGTIGEVQDFSASGYPVVKTHRGNTIMVEPAQWTIADGTKILATIEQLPLRLAWAITVHKSQGMTLDAAVIDLSQAFEYGQGYVALSRVRSLSTLHLLGINARALEVHPEVAEQDRDFKVRSAAARKMFDTMENAEHSGLARNFVVAVGGNPTPSPEAAVVIEEKSKPKGKTLDTTLTLLHSGKNVAAIAKARGLAERTITAHIVELFENGRIKKIDVEPLMSAELKKSLPEIFAVFKKLGIEKLAPIFNHLKEKYPYEDLHLARLMFGKDT